jgi:hypothetical protein
VERARRGAHVLLGEASRYPRQHRAGLRADVFRGACPDDPPADDLLAGGGIVEAIAVGEYIKERDGHAGVIGPLMRSVPEHAPPERGRDVV